MMQEVTNKLEHNRSTSQLKKRKGSKEVSQKLYVQKLNYNFKKKHGDGEDDNENTD